MESKKRKVKSKGMLNFLSDFDKLQKQIRHLTKKNWKQIGNSILKFEIRYRDQINHELRMDLIRIYQTAVSMSV